MVSSRPNNVIDKLMMIITNAVKIDMLSNDGFSKIKEFSVQKNEGLNSIFIFFVYIACVHWKNYLNTLFSLTYNLVNEGFFCLRSKQDNIRI